MKFVLLLAFYYLKCVENSISTDPNNDWCPSILYGNKCKHYKGCAPCNKKFLFIIAQPRTGSTTIKNMLNLLPGVRIGGEIGLTLSKMVDLWKYVHYGPDHNLKRGRGNMEGPWGHFYYANEYLACPAQELIASINPPENIEDIDDPQTTILGFKETQLYTKSHFDFLLKYFPCSRFIFSTRSDTEALTASQKKNVQYSLSRKFTEINEGVLKLYEKMQTRDSTAAQTYLMDLDAWSMGDDKQSHFNNLASWLGFENCTYPSVLVDNSMVGSTDILDAHRFELTSDCHRKV